MVKLKLAEPDAEGQFRVVSGVIRITDTTGNAIQPSELMNRRLDLKKIMKTGQTGIHDWSVMTGETEISFPRKKLVIEAFSGLETELAHQQIDLTNKEQTEITLRLTPFHDTREQQSIARLRHICTS